MGILFSACGTCCRKKNNNNLIDFFNSPEDRIKLEQAWEESPDYTMKILFTHRKSYDYIETYRNNIVFLAENHPSQFSKYIKDIPKYGTYKDLLELFGTPLEEEMIDFYADELFANKKMTFKYTPTEGCYYDKLYQAVSKFCEHSGLTKREYRRFISSKRKEFCIVESIVSSVIPPLIAPVKIPKRAAYKYGFGGRLPHHNGYQNKTQTIRKFAEEFDWHQGNYTIGTRNLNFTSFINISDGIYANRLSIALHMFLSNHERQTAQKIFSKDRKEPPFISTPENLLQAIYASLFEVKEPRKDRFFVFGGQNPLLIYKQINNPTVYDIIFWDPRPCENFKFLQRKEDGIFYVRGFNEAMLNYFIHSDKISFKSFVKALC